MQRTGTFDLFFATCKFRQAAVLTLTQRRRPSLILTPEALEEIVSVAIARIVDTRTEDRIAAAMIAWRRVVRLLIVPFLFVHRDTQTLPGWPQ